jgi:hypothetical protein
MAIKDLIFTLTSLMKHPKIMARLAVSETVPFFMVTWVARPLSQVLIV